MSADPRLVEAALVVVAAVLASLMVATLVLTAVSERVRRRRWAARGAWLEAVRPRLDDDASGPRPRHPARRGPAAWARLGRLAAGGGAGPGLRGTRASRVAAVAGLTGPLGGQAADSALSAAGDDDLAATARRLCTSRRWWRRLRGVRALAALPPAAAAGIDVAELLDDPHPQVRAEAAVLAAHRPSPRALATLARMLDGEPRGRWAAADALLRVGPRAVPLLAVHLRRGARRPEVALRVAAGLADPELLPPALAYSRDRRAPVRAAAAHVLAAVGGKEAATRLAVMLDDADPGVRAAAAHGLGRLEHWPAAVALGHSLGDPQWEVRRAAALALRSLGPIGRLQLRRAASGADPSAAEIARHVTDLPATALGGAR